MAGGKRHDRLRDESDRRVLSPATSGRRAVSALGSLCAPAGPRLEIDARALTRADAFTGVVVHEAVRRHLWADPGHEVVIREPADADAWSLLHDLVGELPRAARWAREQPAAQRERQVLVPATPIKDEEDIRLTGEALLAAAGAYRIRDSPRRLLVEAAVAFADNALEHGAGVEPLLCACHDTQANDLQAVVLSAPLPDDADATALLRDAVDRGRREILGIVSVIERVRRRGLDATVRIAAGDGRLYWRGHTRPGVDREAPAVPAFVASLQIHLPGQP